MVKTKVTIRPFYAEFVFTIKTDDVALIDQEVRNECDSHGLKVSDCEVVKEVVKEDEF